MTRTGDLPVAASLRTLLTGLLVAVPLVFDPRAGHAGARPKYLLLVAGGAVVAVITAVHPWRANRLNWPVVVFVACAAFSAAVSPHRATAVPGYPGSYDGLWTTAALAAVCLGAAQVARRPADVRRMLSALCFGAGGVVLAFAVGQLVDAAVAPGRGWDWARPADTPRIVGSTLGNPNHLASFLAILLPLVAVLALLGGRRTRVAAAVLGAAAVGGLAVTVSRGGIAAALAGLAVLAALFRRDLRPYRRIVVTAGAAVAAAAVVLSLVLGAAGMTKIDPTALGRVGAGSTADLRLELWSTAWRVAVDHPLVGVGPDVFPVVFPEYESDRFIVVFGAFTVANGAHNLFLNILANLGVAGLAAFLAVLAVFVQATARAWGRLTRAGAEARERRLLLGGLTAAVVAYLVQACVNNQELSLSLCFWALLGLAVGLGTSLTPDEEEA